MLKGLRLAALFTSPRVIRGFHCSALRAKVITELVPPLGESITEGSVASWLKTEGDQVVSNEVVVIVETDKVTVDIKANHCGIFRRKLVKDSVFVGKPLYDIDVNEDSNITAPVVSAVPAPPASNSIEPRSNESSRAPRKPTIKFVGKRSREKSGVPSLRTNEKIIVKSGLGGIKNTSAAAKAHHPSSVDFFELKKGAWFGRPELNAREMQAIETGGAL